MEQTNLEKAAEAGTTVRLIRVIVVHLYTNSHVQKDKDKDMGRRGKWIRADVRKLRQRATLELQRHVKIRASGREVVP